MLSWQIIKDLLSRLLIHMIMNKGFSDVSSQLERANTRLDHISINTALSAYYAEKTAQYTKQIALTSKATAWLIALK